MINIPTHIKSCCVIHRGQRAHKIMATDRKTSGSRTYTVNEVSEALDRVSGDYEVEGAKLAVITEERYEDVLKIIGDNFLPDEAISVAYGLVRCPEWDDLARCWLRQNLSVMVVHKETGDVMGVRIISVTKKDSPAPNIDPSPFKDVFDFLAKNEQNSDIFNQLGLNELFHFCLIAVSRKYRKFGLGTKLMGACIALGRELGFKAIDSQATSNYSQKIFKRYGFEILLEVPYASIQHNGEPLRNRTMEHDSTQVVVKKLNSS